MPNHKKWKIRVTVGLDLLLVVFTLPAAFVTAYFFPLFLSGANRMALAKSLGNLSLHLSWVSAPLVVISVLTLKFMISRHRKWFSVMITSFAFGVIWLVLWNIVVEKLFTFWRSVIPLSLCCLVSVVYVMGKTLYNKDSLNFSDEPDLGVKELEHGGVDTECLGPDAGSEEKSDGDSGLSETDKSADSESRVHP
jgi:hypothetical protein